ncbi:hypothetical protein D3C81_1375950 [compost metagenome]
MIATTALASVVLLPSVTVIPESITTGVEIMLSPATNEAEPPLVVKFGGPFITFTVFAATELVFVPSFTA